MTIKKFIIVLFFAFELVTSISASAREVVLSVSVEGTIRVESKNTQQDSVLIHLKKKQTLARQYNNTDSIIKNDLALLRYYTYSQSKNTETDSLFCLIDYCKDNDNLDCVIEAYSMLALQMQKKNKYLQALEYYTVANELLQDHQKGALKWSVILNQGTLFIELLEPELAKKNFKESLTYISSDKDHYMRATSLLNISSTFEKTNPDSMAYYSGKALDILVKNPDKASTLEIAANNMAYAYIRAK